MFRWYVERHGGLEITPGYYELARATTWATCSAGCARRRTRRTRRSRSPRASPSRRSRARLDRDMETMTEADFAAARRRSVAGDDVPPSGRHLARRSALPRHLPGVQRRERGSGRPADDRPDGACRQPGGHRHQGQARGQDPYGILVIASLIEREAKTDEDRAKIARVIYNRLEQGDAAGDRRHRALRHAAGGPRSRRDPVQRPARDAGLLEHVPEHRPAADADRQPRPGVDPGRASTRRRTRASATRCASACPTTSRACTCTTCSPTRRAGTPSPRRPSSTTPTSAAGRRRACWTDARCPCASPRLIGSPIAHSLSPAIHNAAFAAAGLDWVYVAFEVAPGDGRRRRSTPCVPSASPGCR